MPRYAVLLALMLTAIGAAAQPRDRAATLPANKVGVGESRSALVIGNSAYSHGALRNPINDARAMAKALTAAGFEVRLLEDATLVGMQRAVRQWGNALTKGSVGLFYYAGHGMQVKGRNYLVPVNAEIEVEDEVEFNSLDVNQVLAKMDSAKNPLNIIILDACRNNPFARSFRVSATGLAQMDAPTGSFIAFATAPGSTAADGASGENGIYTHHLLRELPVAGTPIEQVFKRVRNSVIADTRGQQVPWESSSLRGEFAFVPGSSSAPTVTVAEMERVIQAALEKQRTMLEAQGIKAAASKPATQLASAAPLEAAAAMRGSLPSKGDTWTYKLTEPKRRSGPKQRSYNVKVEAASPWAILEQFTIEGEPPDGWVHAPGAYLVSTGVSILSPYLVAFQDLSPGRSLGRIEVLDPACTRLHVFCNVEGSVVGRETLNLPSGRFDTIKVTAQQTWQPGTSSGFGSIGIGAREITVWYAPSAKRAVKITSRLLVANRGAPVESDFDLELVDYELK